MNSRSRYLTELEGLEAEFQKLKLLKESLNELAKSKKPDMKQFKEAAVALMQNDGALNKLACGDLQKQVETLGADKTAVKRIGEQMIAKNCK